MCFADRGELQAALKTYHYDKNCRRDANCPISKTYGWPLNSWFVGHVTDMHELFLAMSFNMDISSWDTSSVTTMDRMFSYATYFNQDISSWDTSSVTDMSMMFSYATSFNQDISYWDTSRVINMPLMFSYATSFNQDISYWATYSVIDMRCMIYSASSFNQNLCAWRTLLFPFDKADGIFSDSACSDTTTPTSLASAPCCQDYSFTGVCLDGSGNHHVYMKLHSSMNVSECQQYCSNMPGSEDQIDFSVSTKLNLCRCDYEAGTLPSAESFPSDVISAPSAYTQGSGRVMSGNGNVDWKCYPIQSRNLIVKSDFTVSVFVLLFL